MLSDILEIDQPTLKKIYDFTIQSGGNTIIFGPAGIGKTEMAIQSALDSSIKHTYVNLSVLESVDLVGLPEVKDGVTSYAAPNFLPSLDDEPVVLILDEVDKCLQELQNPMLELFQFRSINGKSLNIKAILATGNLPDEKAFSRKISHALTNRCMIYKITHNFDAWRRWALGANINSLIIGFLERNQDLLLTKPHVDDPTAYCSPSPRAWTLAAKDLDHISYSEFKSMYSDEDDSFIENEFINFQFKIVSGRVGFSAAFRFKTWLKYYRDLEPMIDDLVDNGNRPEKLSSDSIMIFTISALSKMRMKINSSKDKLKYAENVFQWMRDEVPPEFCLSAMKCTINNAFLKGNNLFECEALNEIFDEISELVF